VAGTGVAGFFGDLGLATLAQLHHPFDIQVDRSGRIFVADTYNSRIRMIDSNNIIQSVAGTGEYGFSGEGVHATQAGFAAPGGLATTASGAIVVSDFQSHRVRRFDVGGDIATIIGTGRPDADGVPATSIATGRVLGMTISPTGDLTFADGDRQVVRQISSSGHRILVGNGVGGNSPDNILATETLLYAPTGIAYDSRGQLYFADRGTHRIRMVTLDGHVQTVAGVSGDDPVSGYNGDGGIATDAKLTEPFGVAIDSMDRVYISDSGNNRIRRIERDGTIVTVAGTGVAGFSGDNGPAVNAQLNSPYGIAIDSHDRLLIADRVNGRIRRLDQNGFIATVAGNGGYGYSSDDGPATQTSLAYPWSIAVDSNDRIVIADTGNHRVRKVDAAGIISTIAGTGAYNTSGDGGPAMLAEFKYPVAVSIDAVGGIYASTQEDPRVHYIDSQGIMTSVAGILDSATAGLTAQARLTSPQALATYSGGTLVATNTAGTVEAISLGAASQVSTVAGRYPQQDSTGQLARYRSSAFGAVGGVAYDAETALIYLTEASPTSHGVSAVRVTEPRRPEQWQIAQLAGYHGAGGQEGGLAVAQFRDPSGLYFDKDNRWLYVVDTGNHAIRRIDLASETVTTIVNTAHALGKTGDNGPAADALLYLPTAMTQCPNGDLFIADTGNHRIRRVAVTSGVITTVLGDGTPGSSGEGSPSNIFAVDTPQGVACDSKGNVYVSSSTVVKMLTADGAAGVDGHGPVLTIYGESPRDAFPQSTASCLTGLMLTSDDSLQVADGCTGLLVQLTRRRIGG
jgi:sugar lactone lactonase YvrE